MVTLKEKKSFEQSLQRPLASSCCECCDQNDAKQECIPVRCVPSDAVAVRGGGVSDQGRRVSDQMGCVLRGRGSAQGGVCPSACWDTHLPPWTEFLTHACENITFPQIRCGRYSAVFILRGKDEVNIV